MSRLTHALQYTKHFFGSTSGKLLLLAIGWQVVMTIIGWLFSQHQGLLGHIDRWDAGWYKHIIEYGYGLEGSPAAPAFYPLFPLLIKTLTFLSFGLLSLHAAVIILNTFALWLGLIAILKVIKKLSPPSPYSKLTLVAFLSFPSAFFMHTFYSEALFIALAFWAYAFALERKWWAVGALLALLTASRLPSLLFIALCGLEFLRAHEWNIKRSLNENVLWFFLAPLGFLTYGVYLQVVRGDFLAMFHAYATTSDWTYHHFSLNIFATLYETIVFIVSSVVSLRPTYEAFINYGLPLLSLAVIISSSVYILYRLRSRGVPLFIFGLLSVLMFTVNSNIVSVHRYALACICIYIAVSLLPKKTWVAWGIVTACIFSVGVQLFIFAKFANGMFGG